MDKIKIAICDDEQIQTALLSSLVNKWSEQRKKVIIIQTFDSAEAFHFLWVEDKSYDILLLDIQMGGQNGIELAKEIRKTDEIISIIFITGLSDYINEGYDVSALHYLMKPIKTDKLFDSLDKACKKIVRKEKKSILIDIDGQKIRIMQEDIQYVEAFAHNVLIQTLKNSFEVKKNIGEIEKELCASSFSRCHRSYMVGLRYISKICKTDITLDSGQIIPLSRRLYNNTNNAFISYYKGNI